MGDETPSVTHAPETGVYQTTIDLSETEPVYAVVLLLQAYEKTAGIELPPLYELIDCDALDRLLVGYMRREPTDSIRVEYTTTAFELIVECQHETAELRLRPEREPPTDNTDHPQG